MTRQEYNRDVKRLRLAVKTQFSLDMIGEDALKKEFNRLYDTDRTFELANAESVKTMFRMNQRFRFVPLHFFGIYIDL